MSKNAKRKVLVVDDDAGIRMTVRASLMRHGYEVIEAESGEHALTLIESAGPELVLLDIVMPGISGFETCEHIRKKMGLLYVPIIMLTGMENTAAVKQAFECGATDFVTKPINFQLMNFRVDYVLKATDTALDLHYSRLRQSHAQRIANLGHIEWDSDSRITYCSSGMHSILGVERSALPHGLEGLLDILGPEEKARARLVIDSTVAAQGRYYSLEHLLLDSAGKPHHVVHNAEITYNGNRELDRVIATFQDVTSQRMAEREVHRLANFDALTGLPKRELLLNYMEKEIEQAARYDTHLVVVVVGIDGLHKIRDALGHKIAEEFIRAFAEKLGSICRSSDYLSSESDSRDFTNGSDSSRTGRLSGDEFVIILPRLVRPEDSRQLLRRISEQLNCIFTIHSKEVASSVCMGISVFPMDGRGAEALLRSAEVALNVAREQGSNTLQYYTESLNQRVLKKFSLENDLRKALESGDLKIHYQPQQSLSSGDVIGMEALARWLHSERGYIPPPEFIEVAEEAGLIDALGDWVFWTVCNDINNLHATGAEAFRVAINLSPIQFRRPDLVNRLKKILEYSGVDGQLIEFELTESVLLNDIDRVIGMLSKLRDFGCTIAIDDFGTGYSSLSYLKRVPAQILKIDRSFVRDLDKSSEDRAIVHGIVQLGHSLSMNIIAEGVETTQQKAILTKFGCDVIQGYLFSRPQELSQLQIWLDDRRHLHKQALLEG